MNFIKKSDYLFKNVSSLKGVGTKLSQYLKNKKIEKINDLLWNLPHSFTDRSDQVKLNMLEIGKIQTIKIKVSKYQFPRIRRLPNRIICEDDVGKIDLVFFNSREGYLRKILPINEWVIVSGKINYYKKKYQITNPEYITTIDKIDYVRQIIPKYSLTEGINEKAYRKIIEQVLIDLPNLQEWHDNSFIEKMSFLNWKDSITKLHQIKERKDINSNYYKRLAYDEILSHLLVLSENRKRIKKIKKNPKTFSIELEKKILKNLPFKLTKGQTTSIEDIKNDFMSSQRMFRIMQGDVGSGKTIVAFLSAASIIESKYQCALMAPTAILANQHYELAKKIFKDTNINIAFVTGKTKYKEKKKIFNDLKNHNIDFIIGTHSLFQKKIIFKKLGFIIVDEQHKFGVKQRMDLAKKGGDDCDVLLMSATPIPRTMMLSIYGDMDVSKIKEKPVNRKDIITLSKPENKINDLWPYIKKELAKKNQIFWVCPLIEESKILNFSSAVKRFEIINKLFPGKAALLHGSIDKENKERILLDFKNRKIEILVSTTVIEVGIDFPNANLIIIENANKFGLAQLHQLRGRVGRGEKQGTCILLFKDGLSKSAIKRIKLLKKTNDGFLIAEEDMRLRGYGDIVGFQQSGIKYFKIADPIHHEDLFKIAEKNIKIIEDKLKDTKKYNLLLKLFDKAEVINDLDGN
jgi:ATP-dependent DNA helicase RecG